METFHITTAPKEKPVLHIGDKARFKPGLGKKRLDEITKKHPSIPLHIVNIEIVGIADDGKVTVNVGGEETTMDADLLEIPTSKP